jgi:hypothetical protein
MQRMERVEGGDEETEKARDGGSEGAKGGETGNQLCSEPDYS